MEGVINSKGIFLRSLSLIGLMTLSLLIPSFSMHGEGAQASKPNFFGVETTRSDDLSGFSKWRGLLARQTEEREAWGGCREKDNCPESKAKWENFMAEQQDKDMLARLENVQDFFNKIAYREDKNVWKVEDYWATPGEFIARGGDCEEFASAKYFALRELGFNPDDMRLVIVKDSWRGNMVHAVLEITYKGERLILDNQSPHVLSAESLNRYLPVYAITDLAWWSYPRHGKTS